MNHKTKAFILSATPEAALTQEAREILAYSSPEFQEAFSTGAEAEWEPTEAADPVWFPYWAGAYADDDPNGWKQTAYYMRFRTKDGKLYRMIMSLEFEGGGGTEFVDEAEMGTPADDALRKRFSQGAYDERGWHYLQWVQKNGEDPLHWLFLPDERPDRHEFQAKAHSLSVKLSSPSEKSFNVWAIS